jgi:cob(I)alamin adenosyltransferase
VKIYTKRGDDGTTGLLYGGRIGKDDPRTEAYGTTDEAVAALGVARVHIADSQLADLVLRLQRELFVVGAELATATENADKLTPGETQVTSDMVEELERLIDAYTARIRMPQEFIIPGESRGSAFLDVARAVIRRAERRVVEAQGAGLVKNNEVVRYLNRLSDLVFVLARYEEGDFRTLRSSLRGRV